MAKVLSIELGHSVIKLCEMDYKVKKPKIYQCQEAITPNGAVTDGYINEAKMRDLAYAIKETIARNGIKTKKVIFTVASAKIITREVTVPAVKETQISSVIQANLSEYFPVSLADYEVTQSLIQTINEEGPNQGKHRVLVFAAEKALVNAYKRLSQMCELDLVNVCCSGASIIEAARGRKVEGCQAIIKMEERYSIISVMSNGVLLLQRSINYGIGEAMAEVASQPSFAAPDTLAVWRLITRQNCTNEAVTNTKLAGRPEAREAVSAALNPLLSGIMRVFDYFNSHFDGVEIQDVAIIGLGAQFIGVSETLGEALGIVCKKAGMFQDVETYDSDVKQKSDAYFSCIGAGFATDGFVHETEKGKISLDVNYVALSILVGVLCVIVAAAMSVMSILPYKDAQNEQRELEAQRELYQQGLVVYDQYVAVENLHQQVRNGNIMTQHSNDSLLVFLKELEEKMPADAVLTSFLSNDEQCVMTMKVADKGTAARVIDTLRRFASLQDVTVTSLNEVEIDKDEEEEGEARESEFIVLDEEGGRGLTELVVVETEIEFSIVCTYYPIELDTSGDEASAE